MSSIPIPSRAMQGRAILAKRFMMILSRDCRVGLSIQNVCESSVARTLHFRMNELSSFAPPHAPYFALQGSVALRQTVERYTFCEYGCRGIRSPMFDGRHI